MHFHKGTNFLKVSLYTIMGLITIATCVLFNSQKCRLSFRFRIRRKYLFLVNNFNDFCGDSHLH